MPTADVAEPISGDKLYQRRAREALPILVRQAEAKQRIYYSDLAAELGMRGARNLNYVLGSIGRTIININKRHKKQIPPLQCLVLNKVTNLPGEGIEGFLKEWGDFNSFSRAQKKNIIGFLHAKIYAYPNWGELLTLLGLERFNANMSDLIEESLRDPAEGQNRGESELHRRMKHFISQNPSAIGLDTPERSDIEKLIASGDRLDVYFQSRKKRIAVEVKTSLSNEADIIRGLFQCVKYTAVLKGMAAVDGHTDADVRALLVLQSELPAKLIALRNLLGVEVIDGVHIP